VTGKTIVSLLDSRKVGFGPAYGGHISDMDKDWEAFIRHPNIILTDAQIIRARIDAIRQGSRLDPDSVLLPPGATLDQIGKSTTVPTCAILLGHQLYSGF
jgi:hypothetical protein